MGNDSDPGPRDERARSAREEAARLRAQSRALSAESAQAVRRAGDLLITARRIAAECYVVKLAGELDAAVRPAAEEEIGALRGDGRDITVDLSELEFLDSSGLRLLLDLMTQTDGLSPVRLVSASDAVRRLAELTGTAERLGI